MRWDQSARILFAAVAALGLLAVKASDRDMVKAAGAISESAYREQIATLASDEFQGRSPGTAGERKTVEYLEEQFLEMGMQPVAGGSFRQDVALVEITASGQQLSFNKGGGSVALAFGDDMVLVTRRVRDESSIADSEVVFVGYGIVAPEFGWNDYAGLDMRGKTALILVNDPGFVTGDETLFRGKAMTYHGRWTYKFEEAARQGAAAAIIVHDTAPASYDWGVVRNGWSGPQFYADRADANAGRTALEGWITLERAHQVMELAGQDFDKLQSAAVERGFRPVPLGITATSGVRNTIRRTRSPNVVGVMPGKDRPDEYVIYVAHWDHLGVAEAEAEDRIYNGAVDNATGVAGILTIARGFRDLLPGASRSVMYIAVTAEESGLIGSEYYTEHPLVPLAKTAAVINIDALYPIGRAKDVEVIGYGASDLEDLLAAAARKQGRTLTPDRKPEAGYFYRSDHFNFAKAGVPALYIKSGAVLRDSGQAAGVAWQEKYVAERYHKTNDEYADSWNVAGSIEDLKLLFEVGARVANSETWPEWYEGNEFRAARDRSAAAREPKSE
ncbi:MAG TPA: M28 family metallopeptidase [Steroidobacteraceae bacterium]|nr:M28 family metallopeptidase [Steroidobacteraceae bacterium]